MNITTRPAERQVISAEEVARLLGYRCRRSFDNKREELESHGFPHKLPGLNGWSKPVIERWLEANGNIEPAPADDKPRRSRLEERFA